MSPERVTELILQMTEEEQDRLWSHLRRHGIQMLIHSPKMAYYQAQEFGGSDFLRRMACGSPLWARWYAVNIDKGPHDMTRAAACGDPEMAYFYALDVDKCPRNDTRTAACGDDKQACWYAWHIDHAYHPETWAAVSRGEGCFVSSYRACVWMPEGIE